MREDRKQKNPDISGNTELATHILHVIYKKWCVIRELHFIGGPVREFPGVRAVLENILLIHAIESTENAQVPARDSERGTGSVLFHEWSVSLVSQYSLVSLTDVI